MRVNDGHIAVEIVTGPGMHQKGATMIGIGRKSNDGKPAQDDRAPKTPPTPPQEDDEEDGDIATPKRDRDDESP
jgi:hypothetical protein